MDSPHRHRPIPGNDSPATDDRASRALDEALSALASMTEQRDRMLIEDLDKDFDASFDPAIRKASKAGRLRRIRIACLEAAAIIAVVVIAGISAYHSDNLDRGLMADGQLQGAVSSRTSGRGMAIADDGSADPDDSYSGSGISSGMQSDSEGGNGAASGSGSSEYMSYTVSRAHREASAISVSQNSRKAAGQRSRKSESHAAKSDKAKRLADERQLQKETIEKLNKISSELQGISITGEIDTRCGISDIGTECSQTISDANRQINECLMNISRTLSDNPQ